MIAPNMPTVTPMPPPSAGAVTFTSNAQIDQMQQSAAEALRKEEQARSQQIPDALANSLPGFIRTQYDMMRNHRDSADGWSNRMLKAMRSFNGQYEPSHLAEINKFNGAAAYFRLVASKCRGASSLLRDVYLNADRPWGLDPPADPDIPIKAVQAVMAKVKIEVQDQLNSGQEVTEDDARDRTLFLIAAVKEGLKHKATQRTQMAEDKVNDLLEQGGFYRALAEFIVDLPLFPFACIKGPEVKIRPVVSWDSGSPKTEHKPFLCYDRISPFDIWFTPGVASIDDADVVERLKYTRADLNLLLDLPGFNHDAVRAVLTNYGSAGFNDDWESTDSQRASQESRENPLWNRSKLITGFKFSGNVQGLMLLQQGMDPSMIEDPIRDYAVEAWQIGQYIIKVQMAPSVYRRHKYYITSFEKVPGTPVGNGIPDIIGDIQDSANATYRALLNNQAMASGPQVVVMDDRLSGSETGDDMYPWKRWHVNSDPFSSSAENQPVRFFQPEMKAQELLGVFQAWMSMADDASAIPRYIQGGSPGAGAGRTASGLAMLMGNASKILQTVAANIDREIFDPLIHNLLDTIMLTDAEQILDGTEKVVVKGVAVAMMRETQRQRQLEFLQITTNPFDMQIIGPKGRAAVLRGVSKELGLPGEEVVPSADQIEIQQAQAAQTAGAMGKPGHDMNGNGVPDDQEGGGGQGEGQGAGGPGGGPGGGPEGGGGGQQGGSPVGKAQLGAGPRMNSQGNGRTGSGMHFERGGLVPEAVPAAIVRGTVDPNADLALRIAQELRQGFAALGDGMRQGFDGMRSELGAEQELVLDNQGNAVGSRRKSSRTPLLQAINR